MNNKYRINFYLASAIEHNPIVLETKKENWKDYVKKELKMPDVGIYDPVEKEPGKTGKNSANACDYIKNLKRGGLFVEFINQMNLIWWGFVNSNENRINILEFFRTRFLVDGNEERDTNYFGDYEAVARSNFIIAYIEKNVKTVGTICEIHTCYLLGIPVYLILPDQTKTDANSTLLHMVLGSGGEIFYTPKEAVEYIKNKYKIK